MDIEYATVDELVMELIHRTTFVGTIVHSTTEHLHPDTDHDKWQVSTSLPDKDDVVQLLRNVLDALDDYEIRRA